MLEIILYLISWILILLLLIFGSMAVIYSLRYKQCSTTTMPWCYQDWRCQNQLDPSKEEINMSKYVLWGYDGEPGKVGTVGGIINYCSPLSATTINNFPIINADGTTTVRDPSSEKNAWAWSVEDPAKTCFKKGGIDSCPNYKVGDIYWEACTGAESMSNFYV